MGLLRIPRQDGQEGFVLVHIAPLAQKAAATLDVKILATEGSAPFAFTCKLPLPLWPGRSLRGIPVLEIHAPSRRLPLTGLTPLSETESNTETQIQESTLYR